jgi:hypothetical protein
MFKICGSKGNKNSASLVKNDAGQRSCDVKAAK